MLCNNLTMDQSVFLYQEVLNANDPEALRSLCKEDLFFILTVAFKRRDAQHPWLYERCREIERDPNGFLDLWAREHYKSTIITYAKTIQDILKNPDITVGIFSHTRPIAKSFLSQIMRELEDNTFLHGLFPEILYKNPKREAGRWSLDNGILVKRKSNPKEATVEAWGLVDGQPTGKHFSLLVYDDVVTRDSVSNTDMIKKVTEALSLSYNLGAHGGYRRFIGTRYHFNDTYKTIMDRGSVVPRIYAATDDGTQEGKPVFLDKKTLDEKRRDFGEYVYNCQMLQNPVADRSMGFKEENLMYYDFLRNHEGWNYYILCDPAGEKKEISDYSVILVVALAPDNNYYLIDGVRDRLNLTERTKKIFEFHRRYKPLAVGYEKYGKDSDIEHIEYEMNLQNYRFMITPLGGATRKEDRIRKLMPLFEQHRIWLPNTLQFMTSLGNVEDIIRSFIQDEYLAFPVCVHDDMLDCLARIIDQKLNATFPEAIDIRAASITQEKSIDRVETDYELFA